MDPTEVLKYGNTGLLFLMLLGAGWAGRKFLDEGLNALRAMTAAIENHELRSVERHAAMERHITDHMRKSSEEHTEILDSHAALDAKVEIALARLAGRQEAEAAAAERPTPPAGIVAAGGRR